MAYRCYDMYSGTLRHLPMPGAAVDQDDVILNNMAYAIRTWQIDKKGPKEHTGEDKEFMRTIVQPKRGG